MIINSIRLKNIRSYGEGADGDGVTVAFQPGVNRVAGRNGHGKSTLIEALGFALFLAKPDFEETFKLDTYLLRSGTKTGEIDVTFEHEGQAFRIERGVGTSSKRLTKVIDLADGSISAEGEVEVSDFICDLLRFPSAKSLTEVFSKLVGVKQGRLTWPFDSKPAAAKRFFEPLFDVAIFRDCFDKLKPVSGRFREEAVEVRRRLAAVVQKIEDREDSVEKLKEARKRTADLKEKMASAEKAKAAAEKEKTKQEKLETAARDAKTAMEHAKGKVEAAVNQLVDVKKRVDESEKAAEIVKQCEGAQTAYLDAEKSLTDLEKKREQRDKLKGARDTAEAERRDRAGKATAAREQAGSFRKQGTEKTEEREKASISAAELADKLEKSRTEYEESAAAMKRVTENRSTIEVWVGGHAQLKKRQRACAREVADLAAAVAAWDGQKLSDAVVRESAANKVLKEAREALSKAVQKTESLGEQLKQIGGGVCPFLKETCRQFDPAKVQSDVTSLNEDIEKLESRATDAEADFSESKKVLESLKNTESQVTVKKSSLASRLKEYSDEARELFPAEVREAAVKLGGFVKRIPDLPMPPQVAENNDLSAGAIPALHASVEGVLGETERWWGAGDSVVGEVMEVFEQEKKARVREEQQLKGLEERRAGIGKEIEGLREQAEKMETDAKRLEGEALVFGKAVEQLDGKLAPYAGVDDSIKAENANRDKHRNGHQSFLKAKSVADELATRQQTRGEREEKRKLAAEGLEAREKELAAAARAFDAKALADAKKSYDKKREALVEISTHLGHAKTELKREKLRFKEWESARKEKESHDDEIGRLEAALDVTEFARRTLQRAAPAVAQHLCDRIAARAQIVFNQISTDPIELNWDARRYGLRIVPGDRRFAMLSGGEQTKLALALTLAMIEEFGGLKFCIFDEPTYGVDADSRQKLADAILEAQSAAGLEQLLLVSHDDAFEGKIEHAVMLKKTAAAGSELVEVG